MLQWSLLSTAPARATAATTTDAPTSTPPSSLPPLVSVTANKQQGYIGKGLADLDISGQKPAQQASQAKSEKPADTAAADGANQSARSEGCISGVQFHWFGCRPRHASCTHQRHPEGPERQCRLHMHRRGHCNQDVP